MKKTVRMSLFSFLVLSTTFIQPQALPSNQVVPFNQGQVQPGPGSAGIPSLPNGAGAGQLPQMSEEELLRWQEEVDAEIAKFVSTLPPEQQEQFHKDVAELTEVMNNMSEDELTAFVDSIFTEGAQPVAPAAPEALPVARPVPEEVVPAAPAKKEEPVIDTAAVEKFDKAIKILTNIITRIERFLRKSHAITELTGKIEKWISKDKIKEWQVDLTWSKLKNSIEVLDQKLHTVKESVDPKTKKFRYIDDLVKNESLFNNLNKLSTSLTTYEPKVEAPMELEPVSKQSREAIKEVLSALAEAIYTMDLIKDLDALIEKYEPRAKELREEEAGFTKKAYEESKVPRRETPKKEIGSGKGRYPQAEGSSAPLSEYYTAGSPYYGGYSGGYSPYDQAYAPTSFDMPGIPGGRGEVGYVPAGTQADTQEPSGEAQESDDKKGKGESKAAKEEAPDETDTSYQFNTVRSHLDKTADALDALDLDTLSEHVTNNDPIDKDFIKSMSEAHRYIKKANTELKGYNLSLTKLNNQQKEKYHKQMRSVVDKYRGSFDKAITEIENIKKKVARVPVTKQYLYLGDASKKQQAIADEPDIERIKPSANLTTLHKELDSFKRDTVLYGLRQP